jgi:hypothetical protein
MGYYRILWALATVIYLRMDMTHAPTSIAPEMLMAHLMILKDIFVGLFATINFDIMIVGLL